MLDTSGVTMKKQSVRPLVALLAGLLLVLGASACGDDGDGETAGSDGASQSTGDGSGDGAMDGEAAREAKAAKALTDDLFDASDDDFPITPTQAACVGDGMVQQIGVDRLVEIEILTEDLEVEDDEPQIPEADARTSAEVVVGCTGTEIFADQILAEAGDDITPEGEQCVREALDEQVIVDLFTLVFQGDEESAGRPVEKAVKQCA